MTSREYEPDEWIPDVPADAADFLDGDPPLTSEELAKLPAEQRRAIEEKLAEKAKRRAELPDQ